MAQSLTQDVPEGGRQGRKEGRGRKGRGREREEREGEGGREGGGGRERHKLVASLPIPSLPPTFQSSAAWDPIWREMVRKEQSSPRGSGCWGQRAT